MIPFAGDSLPKELTPLARKHIAKVFREGLEDGGHLVDQQVLQELILALVQPSDSSDSDR